jgi:hypothetical protein
MKRIIVFLATTVALFGCNEPADIEKTKTKNNNIVIEVCGETSPVWLIDEINSMIQPVEPNHRPVQVFSTVLDDRTCILITDMVNNTFACAFRFFLCSGEAIPFGTEKYDILLQKYNENRENFTLLWSNSNI